MAETTEIRLPRLADSVTTVRFGSWLKQEGDRVEAGEPIAEVETDKTTVELEAPAAGVLCDLRVAAGADGLEVGAVLGRIAGAAGATPAVVAPGQDDELRGGAASERPGPWAAAKGVGAAAESASVETPSASGVARAVRDELPVTPGELPAVVAEAPAGSGGAPVGGAEAAEVPAATPLALRMAAAAGFDLSLVRAGGPDGRIRKADVDRALAERRGASGSASPSPGDVGVGREPSGPSPVETVSPAHAPAESGVPLEVEAPHREQPLTAMRRVTATRMQQAKQTVPHFYLRTECRVDAALRFLAAAKRHYPDAPPTLTDLVVRAAAFALRAVPEANSAWIDGAVRVYGRVDVAVAVDTSQGLVAPVVRGADGKDLGSIARETRGLAARAREGRLAPAEYAGGTFTVSNLGMHGVESLYAIVNPPQSCILGVGAATRRPVADGDGVGVGTVMACTLSADHRVIDGAAGAKLLGALKSCLEQPGLMLLQAEGASAPAGRGTP